MPQIDTAGDGAKAWLGIEKRREMRYLRVNWRDPATSETARRRKHRHKLVGNIRIVELSTAGFNDAFLEVFNAAYLRGADPATIVSANMVRASAELARARTLKAANPAEGAVAETAANQAAQRLIAALVEQAEEARATAAALAEAEQAGQGEAVLAAA